VSAPGDDHVLLRRRAAPKLIADDFYPTRRSLPRRAKEQTLPPPPLPEPNSGTLVIGPITRAEVPALCERLRALLDGSELDVVACDASALVADLVAVEALARLALTARRLGCRVQLRDLSPQLDALLASCGLAEAFAASVVSRAPPAEEEGRIRAQPAVSSRASSAKTST
jgi:ABC-type transporter Mla MlaB component